MPCGTISLLPVHVLFLSGAVGTCGVPKEIPSPEPFAAAIQRHVLQTTLPLNRCFFQVAIWCVKENTSLGSPHIVVTRCLKFSQRLWTLLKFPEEADCDIGNEGQDLDHDFKVPVREIATSKELHSDIQG